MSRGRLISVAVVATLCGTACAAATASAKIKFQWKVNGAVLAAGQSKTFTSSADGKNINIKGIVGGANILLLSNKISLHQGIILGGTPGKSEEIVLFEKTTVDSPEKCTVETGGITNPTSGVIETEPLVNEIVESQATGEPLILFRPKEGAILAVVKFLNRETEACPIKGAEGHLEGNFLAVPEPQLVESLNGTLGFESGTTEFLLSPGGGTIDKSGLKFGANAATISGLTLNILSTDEKYGAF
jgi:hypothetical protein